jgi:hypothetical protein
LKVKTPVWKPAAWKCSAMVFTFFGTGFASLRRPPSTLWWSEVMNDAVEGMVHVALL